eukprot:14061707-Alexandrium_andersonii.AAC.1
MPSCRTRHQVPDLRRRPPTTDHQNYFKRLQPARGPLQAVSGTFRQHRNAGKRRKALDSAEKRLK